MAQTFRIETGRLQLRRLDRADAGFIYQLVNDPEWLRFIGDRRVFDLQAAQRYIENGPRAMYRQFGYGLYRVALKDSDTAIGICGLLRREALPDPDLGFALLPGYRGHGYALEAATAVLEYGFEVLELENICAITNAENADSIRLLDKLGFRYDRRLRMEADEEPVDLYIMRRASRS